MNIRWMEAERLRVFLGTSDQVGGQVASDALLEAAHRAGLAGGTVFQGSVGFGASSVIHRPHLFRLSSDQPVVVEFVDTPERIEAFVPQVWALLAQISGSLVIRERVQMLARPGEPHDR
ncbi:protein of unknown function DUF190 (plasmid) [Deinococcus geothermalis DSM 11300]|uniref:Uncharacterized protein n=1 Tax=Deinococcus geothermalis (strain DSM 11300 / CIP 105573 / AG-3a) TaxID=319795 RepID=Q1J3F5_DEIGD|nr:DUF190 domain-containing protein [Deinococcus geothermalis]ABF43979.1 protein of unknown function DUF190 [Deinococcus geothermalis DSM 11300]